MSRCLVKLLLLFVLCIVSNAVKAQCDKYFNDGLTYQKTLTIASQDKAISCFEKAKICYDSQVNKDKCDEQIKVCTKLKAQIRKKKSEKKDTLLVLNPVPEPIDDGKLNPIIRRDVQLSLEKNYVKFGAKGNKFDKVKVNCNYQDWKITEQPSWTNCARNENNEIVIEVEENKNEKERTGILKVKCGNQIATMTIIQKPKLRKKVGALIEEGVNKIF